jgi:hypothetical protein
VALVCEAAEEIRIIFFMYLGVKKINKTVTNLQIILQAWLQVISSRMWSMGHSLNHAGVNEGNVTLNKSHTNCGNMYFPHNSLAISHSETNIFNYRSQN